MDSQIKVGHPFFFPTQVVLVDDDPDFLDGVSLMLDRNLSYRLFQSANQALDYVNQAHQQVELLQRCYASYKTGPAESDALSHVDIGKLHLEVLNDRRFLTCSTVIVDYSMPEMNGLEFLMSLKNPFIKKVLLTGQADMELAVKAFNKQLIDQFIDKHDPRLKLKLNSTISHFATQYFSTSFKLITDPIIANHHDGFLVDADFQHYFEQLRSRLDCVEYYMIDTPHSGFLMVDREGHRRCLLVFSRQALDEHLRQLHQAKAPEALLQAVAAGQVLPGFTRQDGELQGDEEQLLNWRQHYFPAHHLQGHHEYFTTLIGDEALKQLSGRQILPYSNFLEANWSPGAIMH